MRRRPLLPLLLRLRWPWRWRWLLPLVGLLSAAPVSAAEAREPARPRIGLVLSGGGARGAAHIGVLKVLEELRIPISAVAGTSMGALVGGVYASGMDAGEMERRLTTVDWDDLLSDDPPRREWPIRRKQREIQAPVDLSFGAGRHGLRLPVGALAGQQLEIFFNELVGDAAALPRFDDLPIPFRAVATDLVNGQPRVFEDGPLPRAMRASMSVPGVFAPVRVDGRLYVDGGLVCNLPVDVARRMGVDLIIAVNLGTSYLPEDRLESVLGVMSQMVVILTQQNVAQSLAQLHHDRDILIEPDLGDITAADFKRVAAAISTGERAARAAAERLRPLGLAPAEYAAWRAAHASVGTSRRPVTAVAVRGLERVTPGLFAPLGARQLGQPLDRDRLRADLAAVYGRGDFLNLDYDLDPLDPAVPARDGHRLIIDAREKPWGPGYVNLGFGLLTDFVGDTRFSVRANYRRTWINRLGAEWLTSVQLGNVLGLSTEFFQPLTLSRSAFVAAWLGIGAEPISVFARGQRVDRYDLVREGAGLDLGATLPGGNAELRLGVAASRSDVLYDTGSFQDLPRQYYRSFNETGPRASFRYDTLDSAYLPRSGQRLTLDLRAPLSPWGAGLDYRRLGGSWTLAFTRGNDTLVGRVEGGRIWDAAEPPGAGLPVASGASVAPIVGVPYYDQFAQGGFLRLSGYRENEFRGNQSVLGGLAYYRRIPELTPSWSRGVYLGVSAEVGWIGDTDPALTESGTRYGSSLFIAIDTLLGGAYLGQGFSGDGNTATYVLIGFP